MDAKHILGQKEIAKILDQLRKPNRDKPKREIKPDEKFKSFADVVPKAWMDLGLEGEPETKLLELMLIGLIEDQFGDWNNVKDAQDRRKKARMRDVTLLSFGLLNEYYHTDIIWSEDRYEKYLSESDFIKLEYPNEGTYQEIKKKWKAKGENKQNRPLNSITHIAGDGKKEISQKLRDKLKDNSYEEYWKAKDLSDDKETVVMNLPKPCFTSKNFPPINFRNDIIDNSDMDTGGSNKSNDIGLPSMPQLKIYATKKDSKTKEWRKNIISRIKNFYERTIQKWFKNKVALAMVVIIISYILLQLLAFGWKSASIMYTKNKNNIKNVPPINAEALATAAYIKDETAPDVESFRIKEEDKDFSLYPGYSKRLDIEQIYPLNANEFSITYEFVPPGLLKVENNYITALNDVPIGNTSVDVIVKATGHAEIVHITIKNPNEKDEISQGGPLFEQSQ